MATHSTSSSLLVAGTLAALSIKAAACATCGCSLSTDAATGYSAAPGWDIAYQFDYIDQNQMRSGHAAIPRANVARINDAGGNQEVEDRTINRYTTLSLAYAPDSDWHIRIQLPYIDRTHTTYGAASNPLNSDQVSGASVNRVGDAKLMASYQGWLPTHNLGIQLGIKLPTGSYGGPNSDGTAPTGHSPVAFNTGPNALSASPANLLDTSLQAGTGSTDVLLGAYYFQPVSQNFDAFLNAQFQSAIHSALSQPGADFRPGNTITSSVGMRYVASPQWVPQIQVNVSRKSHDQGALADASDTAGTIAYLSPGLTASVAKHVQAFGFIQLPIYSKVEGYQLVPRWTASMGLNLSF